MEQVTCWGWESWEIGRMFTLQSFHLAAGLEFS